MECLILRFRRCFWARLLASIFLQTLLYAWMLAVRWQLAKQSEQLRRAVQ